MGFILNETTMIYNSEDSVQRNQKEQEYLDYINNHIHNVNKAFETLFLPILDKDNIVCKYISTSDLKQSIIELRDIITHHDASKFSDDEFDGYRCKYYPTELEKANEEFMKAAEDRYEECWEHHYKTNDHHPKHWVDENGNPTDMSLLAIIHMICDWEGMSIKFGTNTLEWYENNAIDEKKCFTDKTKQIVEDILYNVVYGPRTKLGES